MASYWTDSLRLFRRDSCLTVAFFFQVMVAFVSMQGHWTSMEATVSVVSAIPLCQRHMYPCVWCLNWVSFSLMLVLYTGRFIPFVPAPSHFSVVCNRITLPPRLSQAQMCKACISTCTYPGRDSSHMLCRNTNVPVVLPKKKKSSCTNSTHIQASVCLTTEGQIWSYRLNCKESNKSECLLDTVDPVGWWDSGSG